MLYVAIAIGVMVLLNLIVLGNLTCEFRKMKGLYRTQILDAFTLMVRTGNTLRNCLDEVDACMKNVDDVVDKAKQTMDALQEAENEKAE